jgi:Amt family ammonium transporter
MTERWVFLAAAALLLRCGFALYLAGISRSKNVVSALFRSVVEISAGILAYVVIGAAIGSSWREIGRASQPQAAFVAATFLIGPAVIAGAALERSRMAVGIGAAVLMAGVVSPLAERLLRWNWIAQSGFSDQAGAIFIHFAAAMGALVATLFIGPRVGKYNRDGSTNAIPGHNLPMAAMGILLIFVAWIGYAAGWAENPPAAAMNVLLSASAGALAAALYCSVMFGRQDVLLVFAGLLAGLVSVTAGADRLLPVWAILAGALAGVLTPYAIVRLDLVWKVDDPGSGIAIHGLGGLLSALLVALLAPGAWSQRAGRLSAAIAALAIVGALALVLAGVMFAILRATIGIRVRESDEIEGLDLSEYDLNAYPDFQQTTIKSYHLREM